MDLGEFEQVFRGNATLGPHTIRSPIRYEVWRDFALEPRSELDLLLESKEGAGPGPAAAAVLKAMVEGQLDPVAAELAVADTVIAVHLGFENFLRMLVPFTEWGPHAAYLGSPELSLARLRDQLLTALAGSLPAPEDMVLPSDDASRRVPPDKVAERLWFAVVAARIGTQPARGRRPPPHTTEERRKDAERLARWLRRVFGGAAQSFQTPLESISVNRLASSTVIRSRVTVKADAAARLFDIDASKVGWAVVDTGIDATHPAFRRIDRVSGLPYPVAFEDTPAAWVNRTRVERTYDLVDVRKYLNVTTVEETRALDIGARIEKHCRIDDDEYQRPTHDHGTHVAGILGASWTHSASSSGDPQAPMEIEDEPIIGVCPTINLWDFRVLGGDGYGDEFSILTALNHILRINQLADRLVIRGVNLSLSITHDVANYACGWTPVCQACEKLVDNGVVVVVAAGNTGFRGDPERRIADGTSYLPISITDPGNAERVITVGATHRELPYRYGVSYFSSRGPTADGRRKPDLLAPGEGIEGPAGATERTTLDGTSQAAPHVSGAAALLMARYPELAGQPDRVKRILCETASDLGRDRAFQGHGMVDILRALQSI